MRTFGKAISGIIIFIMFIILIRFVFIKEWIKLCGLIRIIFYGTIFAYILTPLSQKIEPFMPRTAAILIVFLSLTTIIVLLFVLFIPAFLKQIISLIDRIPGFAEEIKLFVAELQHKLKELGLPYSIQSSLDKYIENTQSSLLENMTVKIDNTMDRLLHLPEIFTIPVLSFYFIKDREYFKQLFSELIPKKYREKVLKVCSEIDRILQRFIRGQALIALIVGILSTIGYLIVNIPYALVLGLISGVFELIPLFGPVFGAIPALLITLLNHPANFLWALFVVILVQQIEGNILTPKIMGNHVGLHPIYIIISLWVGGTFFGLLGLLFSVPAVLVLRVILKNIYLSIVASHK